MNGSRVALGLALAWGATGIARAASDAAATAAADADADATADADIVVEGHQEEKIVNAGPLGARSILETPFSVGQVDGEQIGRIAATTIDAAFNYDPTVRSNNSGVASGNTFSVRGQSVDLTNGYKYDGLAFPYWFQDQPIEALSEVQVLKGAGGFVYGYASPSGVVNFVPKKPTDQFVASANVSFRSSSVKRVLLDVGGPFTDGGSTAFRLNAVHEEGQLYNGAFNRNQFVTLWLQGQIADGLTWSVDGFYQRTWQAGQSNSISIGPNVTRLAPVSGKANFAAASDTKMNDVAQVTGRLNYAFAPGWKATAALRVSSLDERFRGNSPSITTNSGNFTSNLLNQNRLFYYYVGQATVDGTFRTGPLEHNLVVGVESLTVDFQYDNQAAGSVYPTTSAGFPTSTDFGIRGNIYTGVSPDFVNIGPGTVNPAGVRIPGSALQFMRSPEWFRYQQILQRGIFASDTIKLGHAELMLGLRYTNYKESNYPNSVNPRTKNTFYNENSVTPVAALSYDIAKGVRAYVSYVQALQRGGTAPDGSPNAGASYGPLKSKQYETGLKVARQGWGGTLALYTSSVPSEFTQAAVPAGYTLGQFVRDGERRFRGVEFEAHGQVTPEWFVQFGVSYLDAKQTKASTAALTGLKVPGTTAFQTSGLVEYAPGWLEGLKIFGGVRHSGKAYGQVTNAFTFDPVTLGDAGISYSFPIDRTKVKLTANVQNIGDTWYWVPSSSGTGLSPGAPRTFSFSVGVETGGSRGAAPRRLDDGSLRDTGWYVGLAAGATKTDAANLDVLATASPSFANVRNGARIVHDAGWAVAGNVGYDFGLFRGEFEISNQQANLSRVTLRSGAAPLDLSGRPAGDYANASGTTGILAFMANGLVDVGGNAGSRWALEAGGGVGLARFHEHRWQLQESVPVQFGSENETDFAWQALAGVRYRLTDHIEGTLRYRFFNIPNVTLATSSANDLNGSFHTHSVQVGVSFRL